MSGQAQKSCSIEPSVQATANLVSLRATSNIEVMLSIFARNDTCSERSEDTNARSWRNSSCKRDASADRKHSGKMPMMRTSNCFTLKLSSEQLRYIKELKETLWELSLAAAKNLLALLQNFCYFEHKEERGIGCGPHELAMIECGWNRISRHALWMMDRIAVQQVALRPNATVFRNLQGCLKQIEDEEIVCQET